MFVLVRNHEESCAAQKVKMKIARKLKVSATAMTTSDDGLGNSVFGPRHEKTSVLVSDLV